MELDNHFMEEVEAESFVLPSQLIISQSNKMTGTLLYIIKESENDISSSFTPRLWGKEEKVSSLLIEVDKGPGYGNKMTGSLFSIVGGDSEDIQSSVYPRLAIEFDEESSLIVRSDGEGSIDSNIVVIFKDNDDVESILQPRIQNNPKSSLRIIPNNKMTGQLFSIVGIGDCNIDTTLQPKIHENFFSTILVSPANRMQGKAKVIASRRADFPSAIQPTIHENLPSSIATSPLLNLASGITVVYRGVDDLPSTINPQIISDFESEIKIKPKNRMVGKAEVVAPSRIKERFYPVKDAFVRSDYPRLNYGFEWDMFVGRAANGEIYRSLVQFDISTLPPHKKIKRAELVLQAINTTLPFQISIHEVGTVWTEAGITWKNQPIGKEHVTDFDSKQRYGEVRADITQLVKSWYIGEKVNNGLLLKSLDEAISLLREFGTKESGNLVPYLEIEYIDPMVYSYGRSNLQGSITTIPVGNTDQQGNITVKAVWWNKDTSGSLKVKYPTDIEGALYVNSDRLLSSIIVRHTVIEDIPTSLTIAKHASEDVDGSIIINRPTIESRLYVTYNQDIESTVCIARREVSDTRSSFIINRPTTEGSIIIVPYEDRQSSIIVAKNVDEDKHGSIGISTPNLEGCLQPRICHDFDSSITVLQGQNNDLEGLFYVNAPDLGGTVEIRQSDDILSSIHIHKTNNLPSQVVVKHARQRSLLSKINVRQISDIDSSIVIASQNLKSHITVRQYGEKDTTGKLIVGRREKDDFTGSILIRGKTDQSWLSSLYVRIEQYGNLPSKVTVRVGTEQNLASLLQVSNHTDFDGTMHIRADKESSSPSSIIVMRWEQYELSGSIVPRIREANDQNSTIEILGDSGYCYIM